MCTLKWKQFVELFPNSVPAKRLLQGLVQVFAELDCPDSTAGLRRDTLDLVLLLLLLVLIVPFQDSADLFEKPSELALLLLVVVGGGALGI